MYTSHKNGGIIITNLLNNKKMKVYVIKCTEWEEADFGLFGPDRVYHDSYLPGIYATRELAEKNKPNDDDKKWYNGKSYTVEEKEVIE